MTGTYSEKIVATGSAETHACGNMEYRCDGVLHLHPGPTAFGLHVGESIVLYGSKTTIDDSLSKRDLFEIIKDLDRTVRQQDATIKKQVEDLKEKDRFIEDLQEKNTLLYYLNWL